MTALLFALSSSQVDWLEPSASKIEERVIPERAVE